MNSPFSLNNLSNDIRWSLDLRWQRPDKPVGFYDMKQGIMLRSEANPMSEIDWDKFNNVDRHKEAVTGTVEAKPNSVSGVCVVCGMLGVFGCSA